MQTLGTAMESYIRELLKEIRKEITIEDEELFFGTTNKLVIQPIDYVKTEGKTDFVAHQTDCTNIVGEIKLGLVTKSDIKKLVERARIYPNTKPIVIAEKADPLAIAEAVRQSVIIISYEGIKKLAKKLGKTPPLGLDKN